jgi:hypothetical protein
MIASRNGSWFLSLRDAVMPLLRKFTYSVLGRKRQAHSRQLIAHSNLFDREWYLRTYPDVAAARTDPLRHFMKWGWREGRDPGPEFATSAYLKANRDVACAGMNPLLHYIEFGHSEGRTISGRAPLFQREAVKAPAFAPPAPVARFPVASAPPVRWRRSCDLEQRRSDLVNACECALGYADGDVRDRMDRAVALLELLSGAPAVAPTEEVRFPQAAERLVDAWYVNSAQLRTRWTGEEMPFVVRAVQMDEREDGQLCLVGEGLVESSVGIVDLHLKNPLFPILVVFTFADGGIRGARMLTFPSLCRGGLHYGELIQIAFENGKTALDPLGEGEALGLRLLECKAGNSAPAVRQIEVELTGADGTGPLFQQDFRLWLRRVFDLAISPEANACPSAPEDYLHETVTMKPSYGNSESPASLIVSHEMIPTISALATGYEPHEAAGEIPVALIVSGSDPSQPSICLRMPPDAMPLIGSSGSPAKWPRVRSRGSDPLPANFPVAAIARPVRRTLSDAELFMPFAATLSVGRARKREAVTWVIQTRGWTKETLARSVATLALQDGSDADRIVLVGTVETAESAVANQRFAGRFKLADSLAGAVESAETDVMALVGAGILLHDNRSAATLCPWLRHDEVGSVSCVIVAVSEWSGGVHARIADGGAVAASPCASQKMVLNSAFNYLWRTSYPVAAPGADLWLARRSSLMQWIHAPAATVVNAGMHVCSSAVTASRIGDASPAELPSFVPRTTEARAMEVQALFG